MESGLRNLSIGDSFKNAAVPLAQVYNSVLPKVILREKTIMGVHLIINIEIFLCMSAMILTHIQLTAENISRKEPVLM